MLTLYHAPQTRSTRIVQLLIEMDILDKIDVKVVGVVRQGRFGAPDPDNPHAEGKVPLLVHDGAVIRESNAIILYLTDLFAGPMGPQVGDPLRGPYLSWLAYYGNVLEPVMVAKVAEVTHPAFANTFRGPEELKNHLVAALTDNPYLLGGSYTAADLLMSSAFSWFPAFTPDADVVRNWVARCQDRRSVKAVADYDAARLPADAYSESTARKA
ncbi:glutathione S-transferase [Loktanella atrilutea]|uniref:Glutathione S-transferase n=1 Tax=Loktanella atrilutea TaxID=366533 RepID=A0A1M5C801_LOKAT|nr:glutathione S-transferase family protein [Loktanella atrilutea]SHF50851.1 glutathione S-transferase [Loktanella atrilutea]